MISYSMDTSDLRLLLPETLWLEPEHYERAKEISDRTQPEPQQWQDYLNALAMLVFADWLEERLSDHYPIHQASPEVTDASYLNAGGFKLCLVATEQVLDEVVSIPRRTVQQPDLAAHLYVVVEVLVDQGQAIIRGFLRYDEIMARVSQLAAPPLDEVCLLPLSALDAEINHLVVYIQYLEPQAIALPTVLARPVEAHVQPGFSETRVRLSQWLQGVLDDGWQTIDALINPEANLAWNTRHTTSGAKGGKLINFGVQLGGQAVVLLVTVTPDREGKIGINAQVLPTHGHQVLPAQLKLTLFSKLDKTLQEVQSREQDNYIQLNPFKGKPGTVFSLEVCLNNIRVRETFEL